MNEHYQLNIKALFLFFLMNIQTRHTMAYCMYKPIIHTANKTQGEQAPESSFISSYKQTRGHRKAMDATASKLLCFLHGKRARVDHQMNILSSHLEIGTSE